MIDLPSEASILVLLVATDAATWLPETLAGLRAQDHRPIDILAVDNASTDGSGARLVEAFGARRVVTLERRSGFGRALAAALKVAADRGLSPDAFLVVHDDVVLQAGALRTLVDEMRRSGAGIVGPKLVEWDDPTVIQDVGQTTDRNGRVVPRVERGEIDQGQYTGAHEALFASSAAMLVHRDVVERVGLFDLRYVLMRDDLDLCWRAKMAGFSTVVTTTASARHAAAGSRGQRSGPSRRTRYYIERNTLATVIKNYSAPRLFWMVPFSVVTSLASALLFLVTGKRGAASQILEALQWNAVHLPSTLRQRVRAQHARTVPDAEVDVLMDHSAVRVRSQVERALEAIAPMDEDMPQRGRSSTWVRAHPVAALSIAAAIVWLVGARVVMHSSPLGGVDMAPFPSSWRAFFAEFASGWRGAGHGGAAPATPAMLFFGAVSFVTFGSGWLAQRLLLLGLPVCAAITMLRLVRAIGLPALPARFAVAAYAASPLVLGLFGSGRFPDLILAATAPAIVLLVLRATDLVPSNGWRDTWGGVAGIAFVASLSPYALVFVLGVAVAVAAAIRSIAPLRRAVVLVAGALVLLFPWSLELFRPGSPVGLGGAQAGMRMRDLLGLSDGLTDVVPWVLSYAIAGAAIAGFAAARDQRRAIAAVLGATSMLSLGAAYAVTRGVSWIAPRPSLPLIGFAVAACVLGALGYEAARPALRARSFGLGHVVAAVLALAFVAQVAASAWWVVKGERPGLAAADTFAPSLYASDAPNAGAFRVAWVGGTSDEPTIDVTGPEGENARTYLTRATGAAADALHDAMAAIVGGATESGGRLLATFGVRYVIVRPDADADVAGAFARQTDLAFFQTLRSSKYRGEAEIYRDDAGLSIASSVVSPGWVAASSRGVDAAAGAETTANAGAGFLRKGGTTYEGRAADRSRYVLFAEEFSPDWRATTGKTSVVPDRSFGWAMRFRLPAGGVAARIAWRGHAWHRLMLLLELLIFIGFGFMWSRRSQIERGER